MSITRPDRRVITFYSFKGGVGRTMALANVAFRLADTHALNVIAVDWDLEAPGLHKFFGIPREKIEQAQGVLDYFLEWREAIRRKDPAPPDASGWLIPITEKPYAPRYGSLSLLAAGRLDGQYDDRLATLDWKEFYGASAGAAAVETLRTQLVAGADIVLVDSRTGFTDAGGICTIQLPAGVVLMAAPNEQSLEGLAQVARSIKTASSRDRAERRPVRVWLSVSRVPSVEETFRADQWFDKHQDWFDNHIKEGLWQKNDHSDGLRTFEIPHRARWGFGEALLDEASGVDARDPLALAYRKLTGTLLRWIVDPIEAPMTTDAESTDRVEEFRTRASEAEQRGDISGLLLAWCGLGNALRKAKKHDGALDIMRRAEAMAIGRELPFEQAVAKFCIGRVFLDQRRHAEALAIFDSTLTLTQEAGIHELDGTIRLFIGAARIELGNYDVAMPALAQAVEDARAFGSDETAIEALQGLEIAYRAIGNQHELTHLRNELQRNLLETAGLARIVGDKEKEVRALRELLAFSSEHLLPLADAAALEARLRELTGAKMSPLVAWARRDDSK